jgi:ATP-dependent helicase YprA (DUF1998 family)
MAGTSVVVQAPTGSGKTYIFELFYPDLKEQAVFTVPTRPLANDQKNVFAMMRQGSGSGFGSATWFVPNHAITRSLSRLM